MTGFSILIDHGNDGKGENDYFSYTSMNLFFDVLSCR